MRDPIRLVHDTKLEVFRQMIYGPYTDDAVYSIASESGVRWVIRAPGSEDLMFGNQLLGRLVYGVVDKQFQVAFISRKDM